MRRPRLTNLVLALTATAIVLVVTPNVEAGGGWGWKKPMNQRLGAFYTSNRAFKKNTSSRYRSNSSRYTTQRRTYQVSPSYHPHVSSQQRTTVIPSTSSTVIRTDPTPTLRVTTIPSQPTVTTTPPRGTNPTVNRALTPAVSTTVKAAVNVTRPIAETTKVRPTAKPISADQAMQSALKLLTPEPKTSSDGENSTHSKGAVRLPNQPVNTNDPGKTSPLPFSSTTDTFWE